MDLDRISVEARQRSPWEALDLGFVMARAWWWPLYLSWFIPSVVAFIICSYFFSGIPWLVYAIVWWLKPLWDRGPLYIASRRLFGEQASARDVLRNLWRLYKTDLFVSLTIRRLSFTRSFDLPLTVLEQLQGKQRSSRQGLLHRYHSGAASWLTVVGFHMESFLTIGLLAFFAMMVPEQVNIDYFNLLVEQDEMIVLLSNVLTFISMSLVGPFFSVAGFALYISRRIDLEAWDVEIRFRHLAATYAKKMDITVGKKVIPSIICAAVLSFSALTLYSPSVMAETDVEQVEIAAETIKLVDAIEASASADSKEKILSVLEGDEFHRIEVTKGWRLKDMAQEDPEAIPEWFIWVVEFIIEHIDIFAGIAGVLKAPFAFLEIILWGLFIAIVLYIVYRYRTSIKQFVSSSDSTIDLEKAPEVMFGLDVTRESLPDDVPTTVRTLWENGDHRAAVSLLYRALLTGLIHEYGCAFADSNTEGECVAIVKEKGNQGLSHYVASLTSCWQQLAYGHIVPASAAIESLCSRWPEVFPDE